MILNIIKRKGRLPETLIRYYASKITASKTVILSINKREHVIFMGYFCTKHLNKIDLTIRRTKAAVLCEYEYSVIFLSIKRFTLCKEAICGKIGRNRTCEACFC